jgi:hypothetical protein
MVGNFCFRPSRGRVNGELSAQGTQFLRPVSSKIFFPEPAKPLSGGVAGITGGVLRHAACRGHPRTGGSGKGCGVAGMAGVFGFEPAAGRPEPRRLRRLGAA